MTHGTLIRLTSLNEKNNLFWNPVWQKGNTEIIKGFICISFRKYIITHHNLVVVVVGKLGKLQDMEESNKKIQQELTVVRQEKNSILQNYQLTMSERASVLQEIRELQENIGYTKVMDY